jgi:hypothetical protein
MKEGFVRMFARSCLVALLTVSLLDLPMMAASEKPLGMVVQAQAAQLDSQTAVSGTNVFPGDAVETSLGGVLQLKLRSSQLYLLSSSAATLAQDSNPVHATVMRGTVGFSISPPDFLELELPEGILRSADGQPAHGQVTIVGPQEVIISSYQGDLILDNDGELHTIPAGKSYRVTMDLVAADQPQEPTGYPQETHEHQAKKRRHLLFALIAVAAVAGLTAGLWVTLCESSFVPSKC